MSNPSAQPLSLALIVEPLGVGEGANLSFDDEAVISSVLSALGALPERGVVLLLHADAMVATATAFAELDLRRSAPLEPLGDSLSEPGSGTRVVHVLLGPSPAGIAEDMFKASAEASLAESAYDIGAAGLVEPLPFDFHTALNIYKPRLIFAVTKSKPSPPGGECHGRCDKLRRRYPMPAPHCRGRHLASTVAIDGRFPHS